MLIDTSNGEASNKIKIEFKVGSTNNPDKEGSFYFDLNTDTAAGVAKEMVNEIQLPPNYVDVISA